MKENYKELPKFVELSHEIGADLVIFREMCKPSNELDYVDHMRHGMFFSYKEQSQLPEDWQLIKDLSYQIAKCKGIPITQNYV